MLPQALPMALDLRVLGARLQHLVEQGTYFVRWGAVLPDQVIEGLSIRTPQEAFFLKQYLDAGFPLPSERFRRPVFDFSENGYFRFIS